MLVDRLFFYCMLLFLIFVLFFPISTVRPSPELTLFYSAYTTIVKKECPTLELPKKLEMGLGTLSMDEIGVCTMFFSKRQIVIDKTFWEMATEKERTQLMFHELTHCILNVGHIEDENHYMNPYLLPLEEDRMLEQVKELARAHCKD